MPRHVWLGLVMLVGCGQVATTIDGADTDGPSTIDSAGGTDSSGLVFQVRVTPGGAGSGTVSSSPAGIDCAPSCSAVFPEGTVLTLTPTAAAGSSFVGWSGVPCPGNGPCTFTVTADANVTATFQPGGCDNFTAPNGTSIPGWTEHVGDWVIDANRMRINQAGGIYSNNVTANGSAQLDGCGRLTALHAGGPAGEVVGVVLRGQSATNYIVALVQDNSSSGFFDSAWIYQVPLADIGGSITGQNFGVNPTIEACVTGTAVTLKIDANNDGVYELTRNGTTTITSPGLTGVMAKSDSGVPTNMPLVDDFCWGPGPAPLH